MGEAVSILVLMEVTLKGQKRTERRLISMCFNPCFNGSDSKSRVDCWKSRKALGFNPCFNGSDSKSPDSFMQPLSQHPGFNPCFNGSDSKR